MVLYTFQAAAADHDRAVSQKPWKERRREGRDEKGYDMLELEIEYLPTGALRPYPRNARTHSKKQIRQIADSIRQFGFTNPLLIDKDQMILAGHGRLAAAELVNMELVPCVRLEHMSPTQKK